MLRLLPALREVDEALLLVDISINFAAILCDSFALVRL